MGSVPELSVLVYGLGALVPEDQVPLQAARADESTVLAAHMLSSYPGHKEFL